MKDNLRLRRLLLALGLSCLAAVVLESLPSPEEAAQKELARALKGGPRGDLPALFFRLHEQGDVRGERQIASLILQRPNNGPDLDRIADLALRDVWAWNTELPKFENQVLKAWLNEHHLADSPQGRRFFATEPVIFSFSDGKEHARLYLEGDWDDEGEIATVRGWNPVEMARGPDGRWSCRQELRLTRLRHGYHAIVRTAPWPDGRAVGAVLFKVAGARTVVVRRIAGAPEEPAAPRPAPRAQPTIDVAVLGVDGGTWRAIIPWVHQGYLPNFARLLRQGALADQVSSPEDDSYPSPANIYSAMTGKLPFRHGMDRGLGGDHFTTSLWRKASPIWKIASDRGLHVASVGMEGTFPPDVLNGEEVSEVFFAANANRQEGAKAMFEDPSVVAFAQFFDVTVEQLQRLSLVLDIVGATMATTSPHGLEEELGKLVPASQVRGSDLTGLTLSWDIGVKETVRYLTGRERHGLFCAYLTGVDAASHMYWDEVQPSILGDETFQAKRGRLFEAYRNADELLGLLLDRSKSLVLFSDHGFGALAHDVSLPVVNVPRLAAALDRAVGSDIKPEAAYYQAKLGGTLRHGWTLWLAPRDEPSAGRMAALLSGMAYLPQGRPIFQDVAVVRERGRVGVRFFEPPVLENAKAIRLDGKEVPVGDVLASVNLASSHMANGIFAAVGPQIQPGGMRHQVKIVDVAPTVLYLAGLPVASDMDGRIVVKAIRDSYLAAHAPVFVPSYGSGGAGWLRLWQAVDWRRTLAQFARRFRAPKSVQ